MLLTYNVANDKISLGFVENDTLVSTASVATDTKKTVDEYAVVLREIFDLCGFDTQIFEGAICSSVVPMLTDTVRNAVEMLLNVRVHTLGVGTKTGLRILTDDPTQLGGDLVAAAVGALTKYKPPMIIVSFGVATTFSVIDSSGAFLGCAIAPGVSLSAEALSEKASLLPHFATSAPKKCIGTNTMESMQSGCVFGGAAMVNGMLSRLECELGECANIVAFGDDGKQIIPLCERNLICDDTVLLIGLAEIYKKNLRHRKNSQKPT